MRNTAGGAMVRRRTCAVLGATALLLTGAIPVAVGATPDSDRYLGSASDLGVEVPATSGELTTEFVSSPTGRWFVELAPEPTVRGGNRAAVNRAERSVAAEARNAGLDIEIEKTYSTLWSGVSATASDEDAEALKELPSVQAVYPVLVVDAPEPGTFSVPEMRSALGMTGADVAQSELGFTGEGVKVAVMDTGVDFDHPDLGGTGVPGGTSFPTERVVAGWDFVGDDFNADASSDSYQPVPNPDPNPDDCHGHGTHVAGIVGASGDPAAGGVRGVAPDVQFGAYRVFGCDGSTTSDIMIDAMERALADGMDVLNMSIGAAFQTWPQYPTAVAGDNLVDAGVVVVASIGNSGASGTWSAGAPGVGEKVIGVASFDNTHVTATTVVVDGEEYPFLPVSGSPEPPTSGSIDLVSLGAPGTDEARTCAPVDPAVATGNAVLVERGAGTDPACRAEFYYKALRAQEAGAAAVVLYNNVPGLFSATVAPLDGNPEITIPVIAVGQSAGQEMTAHTADGATLTWTDEVGQAVNPTGGLISSFSSYGLAADLSLKPDLGAPGGNIWSTYPLEQNDGYASSSGTSMSSPHVAGAAALLLEARPDVATAKVRDVLQNTADPAVWWGNPASGLLEPAHRQGAGLVQIDEAIQAEQSIFPGKLSLGESDVRRVKQHTLTLTNAGTTDVTYTTSFTDAISTVGTPDDPGYWLASASVDMPATVTVPAGRSRTIKVSITPDAETEAALAIYGGFLQFTAEGATDLSVPFAGFAGDYQALPLLSDWGGLDLPALAALASCDRLIGVDCVKDGSWDLVGAGHHYSMRDGDVPSIAVFLEHPAESVTVNAYRVLANGRHLKIGINQVSVERYVGRNSGGVSVYTWDGMVGDRFGWIRIPAPKGRYVLEVVAVNALGNRWDRNHIETWTSPAFTIDRVTKPWKPGWPRS